MIVAPGVNIRRASHNLLGLAQFPFKFARILSPHRFDVRVCSISRKMLKRDIRWKKPDQKPFRSIIQACILHILLSPHVGLQF